MINYSVVHWVDLLVPIELGLVCIIVRRFANFYECAINQRNATLELKYGATQHKSFL
jgi:hypothetical protein